MSLPVQNPRASEALTRAFNLVGRVGLRVEEFIQPVVLVDDLCLGGAVPIVRRASAQGLQAAVAAENGNFQLTVPGGVVIVVRYFHIRPSNNTSTINVHFGASSATPPATELTRAFTDGRLRLQQQNPAAVLFSDTQIPVLAAVDWSQVGDASLGLTVQDPGWVIGSGFADVEDVLEIQCARLNEEVRMVLEWNEFPFV